MAGRILFTADDGDTGRELWSSDGTPGGTTLVTEVVGGPVGAYFSDLTLIGNGRALFSVDDGTVGDALWVTDGSAGGTYQVADMRPGVYGSDIGRLTALGDGRAVFTANDGTHGTELWVTDGTAAGTSLVEDIRAGSTGGVSGTIFALGDGRALFAGNDGAAGIELWVTDGTAAGTSLLVDIRAGANSSSPANFAALGDGRVLFSANNGSGIELWITDGTAVGTGRVMDIRPGSQGSSPRDFTALGDGRMVFGANNGTSGTELWVTDGTTAGTSLVEDIRAGGSGSGPSELTALGDGRVVFVANDGTNGDELWVTDGTAAGTGLVLDVWAGVGDPYYPSVQGLTALGDGLAVFRGNDGVHGEELWVTDGTTAGTSLLRDFVAGAGGGSPDNFVARGDGTVAFTVDDGTHGTELWVTDGTLGGTAQVADVNANGTGGSNPLAFAAAGSEALFFASGPAGLAVWITDGTTAGTRELAPMLNSVAGAAELDGGLRVFSGADADHGVELWVTDGTAAGTALLKDINPGAATSYARDFLALGNGSAIFSANDGTSGYELWATDGTEAGTVLLKDIYSGAASGYLYGFTALGNGSAVFTATDDTHGNELWITDGTAAGTVLLKDLNPGTANSAASGFVAIGGERLLFSANVGSGQELWVTDGTTAGTSLVKEVNPGTESSYPNFITALGNGLALFSATDDSHGSEFWVTDGTTAGTSLLKDILPGVGGGAAGGIAALGDGRAVLVASGTDPAITGTELWVTDGTTAGTSLLLNINAGPTGSYPDNMVALGNGTVVFTALDDSHGRELWVTDGTLAGTSLLKDINVGGDGSSISEITALGNGTAVFSALDADHGVELWVTDGTVAGSHLLADIDSVSTAGSNPANLFLLPDNIASPAPTGLDIAAAQDTGASDTDNITSTTTLTITGQAAPDVLVTLKDGTSLVGQVQSDATTGAWSIDTGVLADGTHQFSATATNASLNTSSGSVALVVKVDTTVPTLAIGSAGGTVHVASQTVSGTLTDANPGSVVEIFDNGGVSPIATASVGGGGAWSTTVTLVGLGDHSLVARATDLADNVGNSAAVVFDLAPAVLAVPSLGLAPGSDNGPSTADGVTGIVAPGFAGVADPGVLVTLREGATVLGSTTADATTGAWQIASVALAAGTHSLTATASEGALSSDPGTLDVTIDLRLRSGTAGNDVFTYTSHAEFTDPARWVDGLGGTDWLTLAYAAPLTDAELSGLSHLERLVLSGGGVQSVVLAGNAQAAFGSQIVLSATPASALEVNAGGLGAGTALVAYGTTGADSLTGGAGNDRLFGDAGTDTLVGGEGADLLDGGLGADTLTGGVGGDLYYVDDAGDVTVELAGEGDDRVAALVSWTLGNEIERLTLRGTAAIDGTGNALANWLDGNVEANLLQGMAGSDRLFGNAGADTLVGGEGADLLDGGLGADTLTGGTEGDVYYVDDVGDVTVELAGGGDDRVASTVTWTLDDNIERLTLRGTAAIDGTGNALVNRLDGNAAANRLDGGAANDRLYGNAGDDTLVGGLGADLLDGGLGADTLTGGTEGDVYYVDDVGDVTVELAGGGDDRVASTVTWTLDDNIERLTLRGTAAIDGTGNALVNRLDGNAAANRLDGGAANDRLYGNAGDDTLVGGLGADLLDGGLGADQMLGGADSDLYYVDDAGDVTAEVAGEGYDRVVASLSWTLGNEVERLTLSGTAPIDGTGNALANWLDGNAEANLLQGMAGSDRLFGNAGADTLVGGEGADLLDGGLGADTLTGGTEGDVYYVDDVGDVTVELAGGGDDRVASTVTWTLDDNIERLTLRGTAAIDGTGNALVNRLDGNAAANRLDGGAANDRLYGNAGDDTLVGGLGADLLTGGTGADVFVFGADDSPSTPTPVLAYDVVADFVSGLDRVDLSTIGGGGLPLSAYAETTSALNDFSAVTAAASAAMASGTVLAVFVAGPADGWLFWNTDGDATTAEQAVLLDGLNGTALFGYNDLM